MAASIFEDPSVIKSISGEWSELAPLVLRKIRKKGFSELEAEKFINPLVSKMTQFITWNVAGIQPDISAFHYDSLEKFFSHVQLLGKGREGDVLASDEIPFVIKVPHEGEGEKTEKELLIGLLGINRLRSFCPNFVYTLGGFYSAEADEPTIYDLSPNQYSSNILCIVQERILGTTLENLIFSIRKTAHPDKVREVLDEIYTQLFLALVIANDMIGFTHYDLHYKNIVVVNLQDIYNIPYTIHGKPYYVISQFLPVIIDFGLARALIPISGRPDLLIHHADVWKGNDMTEMYPLFDVHRMLYAFSSMMVLSKTLMSYLQKLETEIAIDRIGNRYLTGFKGVSIMSFFRQGMPALSHSLDPRFPIYACGKGIVCHTEKEIAATLTDSTEVEPFIIDTPSEILEHLRVYGNLDRLRIAYGFILRQLNDIDEKMQRYTKETINDVASSLTIRETDNLLGDLVVLMSYFQIMSWDLAPFESLIETFRKYYLIQAQTGDTIQDLVPDLSSLPRIISPGKPSSWDIILGKLALPGESEPSTFSVSSLSTLEADSPTVVFPPAGVPAASAFGSR